MVEDEGGKHYFDLSHGIFSTSWECSEEQISLPEVVRGASAIDLYIEALPEAASLRIDDVAIGSGGPPAPTTSPPQTPSSSPTPTTSAWPPVKGNILQNGDFESGSLDPWFCNGCSGSLGTPAHSGEAAFKVDARHARWSGPHQQLDPATVDKISNLNLHFNFSILVETEDLTEWIWKLAVDDGSGVPY